MKTKSISAVCANNAKKCMKKVGKTATKISLTAIVAAQCASVGMSDAETAAAQAAMADMAQEFGAHNTYAVTDNPFLKLFI